MAISTADWPYHLRVPIEYVPSEATAGQMLVLTEKVLEKVPQMTQDLFWLNVKNGGGDIRLCENDDGTGQLPIEVTLCDTVSRKLIIWYRTPTFTGAENLYLFYKNPSATTLPLTNDYGQYAAWQDFAFASHNGLDDVTGNIDLIVVGDLTLATGRDELPNSAVYLDGETSYAFANVNESRSAEISYRAWFRSDMEASAGAVVGLYDSSQGGEYTTAFVTAVHGISNYSIVAWHRTSNSVWGYSAIGDEDIVTTGAWARLVTTKSQVQRLAYLNAVKVATSDGDSGSTTNADVFAIGSMRDSTPGNIFKGLVSEVWWERAIPSEAKVNTEYANQSNNTSFYGEPEFYKNGKRLHGFSGAVSLSTTIAGESYKRSTFTANASISASTTGNFLKRVSVKAAAKIKAIVSGQATKKAPLAGSTSVKATTHATASKKSILAGIANIKMFLTSRFYNKADNVETHTITIQGQLRESIEVKGFVNTNRN